MAMASLVLVITCAIMLIALMWFLGLTVISDIHTLNRYDNLIIEDLYESPIPEM